MKFAKLILKNLMRNLLRTSLTIAGLAVSSFLIITLLTVLTELSRNSEKASPLRLVARHAVSLTFTLPLAYKDKIAAVPGVKLVTPYCWYGGIYIEEKNFFANFAVDPVLLHEYASELVMPDNQWQAFAQDRQACIVGSKLSELYGFKPGQRITLKSPIYNNQLELNVVGVYTGGDEKTLFVRYDYFNESNPAFAKDKAGTFGILAKSVDDVPKISQAVDAMFLNTDAPTKTETEREFALSFEAMLGGVKQFMYLIIAAIAFSLLLVTANAMAMTVRERTREVGTLKAIGFTRGTVGWLFVGEAILLAVIGGGLGVGFALFIFRGFDIGKYIPNFAEFTPTPETLAGTFIAAVLVGLASVAFSAYRVSNLTIAEALRRVE